ncbi:MAG TPA: outer membrane protein transport protein, partial [Desulfomicrobiaceae bacterium]|nr:outer membrane protein transport protein [Desulfomicrobiaceae bacterium]
DEMHMEFDKSTTDAVFGNPAPKNWKDTWRFNVGVEYAAMDWLDLRLGYVYDESPVPDSTIDYMVPANDRHIFGAGTGFKWDSWTLDLAYNYLMILDRDIDGRTGTGVEDGSIDDGQAHMFSMSVGYKF